MNESSLLHEPRDFEAVVVNVLVALFFALLAHLSLKKNERKASRIGFAFLLLYIAMQALDWGINAHIFTSRFHRALELFLWLASLGRSLVLLLTHGLLRRVLGKLPPRIVLDLVQGALFISITLLALDASGVKPTSLLATSAVLTAVLGLSLQETLGNLFAGLAIQGEQPFQVGDWIQFDQEQSRAGRVVEINWRATKIETADRVMITVPNGVIARAPLSNFSSSAGFSRRHVTVDVPYDSPAGVAEILSNAALQASGVLKLPRPDAVIVEFADSSIRYRIRYYVSEHSRATEIANNVLLNAISGLSRQEIYIPFPVRRLEITKNNPKEAKQQLAARREKHLSAVSIFQSLPPELKQLLIEKSHFQRYGAGELIMRQNDPGQELYVVSHGEVRVELDTGDSVVELARLGLGSFFGEMSLLTGEARTASVFAVKETELLVLGSEALQAVFEKDPSAVELLAPAVAQRQQALSEQLNQVGSVYPQEPTHLLSARIRSFFSKS